MNIKLKDHHFHTLEVTQYTLQRQEYDRYNWTNSQKEKDPEMHS